MLTVRKGMGENDPALAGSIVDAWNRTSGCDGL